MLCLAKEICVEVNYIVIYRTKSCLFVCSAEPLQCYICVYTQVDANQTGCDVTSAYVQTAQCSQSHGYDRCMYYRARSSRTGYVYLRRQCATKTMCEERQCMASEHDDCDVMCCQGNLCNGGMFQEKWDSTTGKLIELMNGSNERRMN